MTDVIEYWSNKFLSFDFWTAYSDDYRVYKRGREAEQALHKEVQDAKLSDYEKEQILARTGIESDRRYLESRQKYSCVAEAPLWNEGDGPDLKRIVRAYLSC